MARPELSDADRGAIADYAGPLVQSLPNNRKVLHFRWQGYRYRAVRTFGGFQVQSGNARDLVVERKWGEALTDADAAPVPGNMLRQLRDNPDGAAGFLPSQSVEEWAVEEIMMLRKRNEAEWSGPVDLGNASWERPAWLPETALLRHADGRVAVARAWAFGPDARFQILLSV